MLQAMAEEPDLERDREEECQKIRARLAHFHTGDAQKTRKKQDQRDIQQAVAAAGEQSGSLMEAKALV